MAPAKPARKRANFPLFLHQTGQYAKKVHGRTRYFGTDREEALKTWLRDKDHLLAGVEPPALHPSGCSLRELLNRFLASKRALIDSGELSPRSWRDYYATAETLIETIGRDRAVVGLTGADFERLRGVLAKVRGPVALGNEIQRVRSIFGWAYKDRLIAEPVNFGASFAKPSRKVVRKAKNEAGEKMIEAADLRRIIAAATGQLKAMILLGVNAALGQSDLAALPHDALDLDGGWLDFPRVKTAIPRRCKLWPETVKALRAAIEERPEPKTGDDGELVFLTRFGVPWVRLRDRGADKPATPIDSIQQEWRKLLKALKLPHVGFYTLRRVFRTIADGARDPVAVDAIMGHVDNTMGATYRQRLEDSRLEAVVDVVRKWLWDGKG
jgi:integrase